MDPMSHRDPFCCLKPLGPKTEEAKAGERQGRKNHFQSQLTVTQHSRVLLQAKWPGLTAFVSN